MAEDSRSSAAPGTHHDQLTGWKEIATYFRKGVRTVQRWEADLAMPVRRIRTGRGETIYAFPAELEAWRRALDARPPQIGWDRDDEVGEGSRGTGDGASRTANGRTNGAADGAANAVADGLIAGVTHGRMTSDANREPVGETWREGTGGPTSGEVNGGPVPAAPSQRPRALTAPDSGAVTGPAAEAVAGGEQAEVVGQVAVARSVAVGLDRASNTRRRRFVQWASMLGAVAAIVVLVAWLLGWSGLAGPAARYPAQAARPQGEAPAAGPAGPQTAPGAALVGQPSDIRVDVDTVRVVDADGRRVFEHRFDFALVERTYELAKASGRTRLWQVVDLDGSDAREVILLTRPAGGSGAGSVVVFEANGDVRFEKKPDARVRFGDTNYAPPWRPHQLFVTGTPGRSRLWVVWVEETQGQFPCLLQQISPRGEVLAEYWNAGYIEWVGEVVVGGRPMIAVGAANNDHKGASLALLDPTAISGVSPAASHDKTCFDCGPGGPVAFLVFPRMRLDRPADSFPSVTLVRQDANGTLNVRVAHRGVAEESFGSVHYWLDASLVPIRAEIGADYIYQHGVLVRGGEFDTPFGDRDMREAWPVLVWKGGKRFDPVTGVTTR